MMHKCIFLCVHTPYYIDFNFLSIQYIDFFFNLFIIPNNKYLYSNMLNFFNRTNTQKETASVRLRREIDAMKARLWEIHDTPTLVNIEVPNTQQEKESFKEGKILPYFEETSRTYDEKQAYFEWAEKYFSCRSKKGNQGKVSHAYMQVALRPWRYMLHWTLQSETSETLTEFHTIENHARKIDWSPSIQEEKEQKDNLMREMLRRKYWAYFNIFEKISEEFPELNAHIWKQWDRWYGSIGLKSESSKHYSDTPNLSIIIDNRWVQAYFKNTYKSLESESSDNGKYYNPAVDTHWQNDWNKNSSSPHIIYEWVEDRLSDDIKKVHNGQKNALIKLLENSKSTFPDGFHIDSLLWKSRNQVAQIMKTQWFNSQNIILAFKIYKALFAYENASYSDKDFFKVLCWLTSSKSCFASRSYIPDEIQNELGFQHALSSIIWEEIESLTGSLKCLDSYTLENPTDFTDFFENKLFGILSAPEKRKGVILKLRNIAKWGRDEEFILSPFEGTNGRWAYKNPPNFSNPNSKYNCIVEVLYSEELYNLIEKAESYNMRPSFISWETAHMMCVNHISTNLWGTPEALITWAWIKRNIALLRESWKKYYGRKKWVSISNANFLANF